MGGDDDVCVWLSDLIVWINRLQTVRIQLYNDGGSDNTTNATRQRWSWISFVHGVYILIHDTICYIFYLYMEYI